MDITGYTTLKSIVDDVLNDTQENESRYMQYLRFAERGLQFLHIFTLGNISKAKIRILPNKLTAPYPKDMVIFSRMGIYLEDRFIGLTVNNNIEINRDEDCIVTSNTTNSNGIEISEYNYGVPRIGEFRLNDAKRVFEFSSNMPYSEIILEYVSSGLNQNGETYVSELAREPLIAWVHKERTAHDLRLPQNVRLEMKRNWEEAHLSFRQAQFPTLDEMMNVIYKTRHRR